MPPWGSHRRSGSRSVGSAAQAHRLEALEARYTAHAGMIAAFDRQAYGLDSRLRTIEKVVLALKEEVPALIKAGIANAIQVVQEGIDKAKQVVDHKFTQIDKETRFWNSTLWEAWDAWQLRLHQAKQANPTSDTGGHVDNEWTSHSSWKFHNEAMNTSEPGEP